jgi:hypothetical protein
LSNKLPPLLKEWLQATLKDSVPLLRKMLNREPNASAAAMELSGVVARARKCALVRAGTLLNQERARYRYREQHGFRWNPVIQSIGVRHSPLLFAGVHLCTVHFCSATFTDVCCQTFEIGYI